VATSRIPVFSEMRRDATFATDFGAKSRLVPSGAKEIQDRRTVLSERAVLIRVHRINAATSERSAGTKTNCPNDRIEQETANEAKKNSQNVKHFSLKCFAGFLPISNIRGRLSLDPSPTSSDGK
jgi:hypothetical protein